MAADEKWYFTKEQLLQSPSRKSGIDVDRELSSRQQAANFIQDMGQRLQVSQLCINTAIVYMHRFYVFHSLASFHRNGIASAALFLAAKVEEQPRKLEHVIKASHICLHRENLNLDTKSEAYLQQAQDLVFNENVLLQTLGFDVAIDHPHTHVVQCCELVRASKDLAQTSYFMASNSLHLTTMCLQYKPTVVACFCIHLACKWSNWEIPKSNEGKDWFWYVDKTVTLELLEQLTGEFLAIFDKCPTKLKRKMNQNNSSAFQQPSIPHDGLQFVSNFEEPRKLCGSESNRPSEGLFPLQKQNSQLPSDKPSTSSSASSSSSSSSHPHHQKIDFREYREKKERERLEREKQQQQHHHHQQQQRDAHGGVSSNSHDHSKSAPVSSKGPLGAQSRSSSSSSCHKGYQQQPHMQQSGHFQNTKDHGDSSGGQNFHASRDNKDNNYLKQQPPHMERDTNKDSNYHGQHSQSSSIQHQNYSHKPESGYSHREGARTNHSNQICGGSGSSQSHHSHSSSNPNLLGNQRDFGAISQRESGKDNADGQAQSQKKDMSSSIRDIIGQTLPQTDSHSMTNERKDVRDKNRVNYMYRNMTLPNSRPEILKNGREQSSKLFHDSADKKVDDFASWTKERSFKKEEEEPMIDAKKIEPITPAKTEQYEESESNENFGNSGSSSNNWNYDFGFNMPNVKNEKKELSTSGRMDSVKTESGIDKMESVKSDLFPGVSDVNASKSQAVTMRGMYDSKYKGHHYPSGSKNSDLGQFKNDKQSSQCSSDLTKKFNDRLHDKSRKSETDRVSHAPDAGDLSKHHKMSKEMQEKHKVLMPGQQLIDQKIKDRSSPSKYMKMKTVPRNPEFLKSDSGHFSLEAPVNNISVESDKNLVKVVSDDSIKGIGSLNNFHKQPKSHDFGGLSGSISDSNIMKSSKTSSIFSPDSKIPPQNILSSLEKDVKKSNPMPHRTHANKASPTTSTTVIKTNVPPQIAINTTAPNASSTGSLFSPPLPKTSQTSIPRHRTSSNGSEAELIPALAKMEETSNYENLVREKKTMVSQGEKSQEREKAITSESGGGTSIFDFEVKSGPKDKSNEGKNNMGRSDPSHFTSGKQGTSAKLSSEIRSDLGAVIYPNNPKPGPASKSGQSFSLTEPKLSLSNSISTVNLSGIEKMVDTSISPAKQTNPYVSSTSLKSNVGMNVNFSVPVTAGSSSFTAIVPEQEITTDQIASRVNAVAANQEIIDVEEIGHSDNEKKSEKKKKREKYKHEDEDQERESERKKEKKKHREKDNDRTEEREKHRDKDRSNDKERHREKEIDVVNSKINSEAPIKITIPKDKILGGLKIKISKNYLKKEAETIPPKPGPSNELKIKISKDKFTNFVGYKQESKSSKKRDRSPTASDIPYSKLLKTEKKMSSSSRSNGTDASSRNLTSQRHSVSENGSYIDISSLYDFPFGFEENGEGIIKTPDYDFEALNSSSQLTDEEFFKNSRNDPPSPPIKLLHPSPKIECDESVLMGEDPSESLQLSIPKASPPATSSPDTINGTESLVKHDPAREETLASDDCDVLKNYKSILDSHTRRCGFPARPGDDETQECSWTVTDGRGVRRTPENFETENPHYYNKYFKKDGNVRTRLKDDRKIGKSVAGEERSRFYDSRYRSEFPERRHYRDFRDYPGDSQYYFEGGDRRFDYQKYLANNFYQSDNEAAALNYDINANESSSLYGQNKGAGQFMCDSSVGNTSIDINLQYQYGYYNNYMYNNSGYRFYGNVPFVNMSLIQQQPTPPGTGEASVHLGPPPLPLEPPPDLPPPPETPPPKH